MKSSHIIQDWPIRRKLLVIILATLAVLLLLVMAGLFSYEIATYRTRLAREVTSLGEFIAANAAPTLAFDDAETAGEILATLRGSPAIKVAVIYTKDGRLFASYLRPGVQPAIMPQTWDRRRGPAEAVELVRPLQQKGRMLGTLFLVADMATLRNRLAGYAAILIIVSLATAGTALILQGLLQRLVSAPLLLLAKEAETVANGDLTVQVPVDSADEMGQLAAAFNHMTAQLAQSYEVLRAREEQLRKSETTLRLAIEATGLGTFDFYPGTGELIWSDLAKRHFGLSPTAPVDYAVFLTGLHPDDRERVQDILRNVLQPGSDGKYTAEYRTIGIADGTERWLVARGQVFFEDGQPYRLIGATLDITDRKRAEQTLRRNEARFRALVAATSDVLYRMSPDWTEMIQLESRGVLAETREPDSKWAEKYIHPDDQKAVMSAIREAISTKSTFELEHRVLLADGSLGWTFSRAVPVQDRNGDIIEWFGAASDITKRKRAEAALQRAKEELEVRVAERTAELTRALETLRAETAERIHAVEELHAREQMLIQQSRMAAMGEMLVNISHQWRQPLTVLGLILQELQRNYTRGKFSEEYLSSSVARGRQLIGHMSQTIDDFRNFLTPQRAKSSFSVKEVVEQTLGMIEASLKEVRVELQAEPEADLQVEGYRNEYAQVVINILNNARDAFREKRIEHPEILVKIFRETGKVVVTIADNAGGIPPEVIGKVFDPYFTTKAPDKGTGIGLYMSKTIIEQSMNGSLSVRNIGTGAEFRIEV